MYYSNFNKMEGVILAPATESLSNHPVPGLWEILHYFPPKINSNYLYFRCIPVTVTPF
jgi:hypothetical protein